MQMVDNFTGFAPLGTVLVAMLGIGVAEKSGLIASGIRLLVHAAPRHLLTFVLVFAGVMSNMASDIGYVLLVPLGATLFYFSDLSVATLQFTSTAFPHYVWGLPFYYTGQLMLALSVSYVRKKENER